MNHWFAPCMAAGPVKRRLRDVPHPIRGRPTHLHRPQPCLLPGREVLVREVRSRTAVPVVQHRARPDRAQVRAGPGRTWTALQRSSPWWPSADPESGRLSSSWAVGAAGARLPDTEKVTGSNPVRPTRKAPTRGLAVGVLSCLRLLRRCSLVRIRFLMSSDKSGLCSTSRISSRLYPLSRLYPVSGVKGLVI
jgi:hypothetical protein